MCIEAETRVAGQVTNLMDLIDAYLGFKVLLSVLGLLVTRMFLASMVFFPTLNNKHL